MKKKIAILGSTGTIGKTLIKIINKDKKNFDIFSDTWEVTWIETSLFDLDDENGLVVSNDQNTFFIIVYVKEAD